MLSAAAVYEDSEESRQRRAAVLAAHGLPSGEDAESRRRRTSHAVATPELRPRSLPAAAAARATPQPTRRFHQQQARQLSRRRTPLPQQQPTPAPARCEEEASDLAPELDAAYGAIRARYAPDDHDGEPAGQLQAMLDSLELSSIDPALFSSLDERSAKLAAIQYSPPRPAVAGLALPERRVPLPFVGTVSLPLRATAPANVAAVSASSMSAERGPAPGHPDHPTMEERFDARNKAWREARAARAADLEADSFGTLRGPQLAPGTRKLMDNRSSFSDRYDAWLARTRAHAAAVEAEKAAATRAQANVSKITARSRKLAAHVPSVAERTSTATGRSSASLVASSSVAGDTTMSEASASVVDLPSFRPQLSKKTKQLAAKRAAAAAREGRAVDVVSRIEASAAEQARRRTAREAEARRAREAEFASAHTFKVEREAVVPSKSDKRAKARTRPRASVRGKCAPSAQSRRRTKPEHKSPKPHVHFEDEGNDNCGGDDGNDGGDDDVAPIVAPAPEAAAPEPIPQPEPKLVATPVPQRVRHSRDSERSRGRGRSRARTSGQLPSRWGAPVPASEAGSKPTSKPSRLASESSSVDTEVRMARQAQAAAATMRPALGATSARGKSSRSSRRRVEEQVVVPRWGPAENESVDASEPEPIVVSSRVAAVDRDFWRSMGRR
ncbi:uncharacterized protein AMSG_08371 [Thecamonas trahens ATCC 50062]|uniref:Uncharacterized protein n=1 Tax=Thecamonas trahens ATCC 50062 TaxID=461836 RepID=A0A0L0DJB1_THETB|nr:hypothetical protein AMSG_08371 [Thecamonas trahens ATCC 50062]KNC52397.1 hypothetical protein AMSG_08371 [Thecamonas trahens ATCC 50062]|eukprot:XP_013755441.1 hypothetical protein AMSG_08371 [Thecamonas trahens ATCC 50062]